MAAAVRTSQGRLVWEAMAMANAAEVRTRIERILDETRQIPRGFTRARWLALLACSVPLIWLVSVTHLVAQETPKTPAAMSEYLKSRPQLTPSDVTTMEQYLVNNPNDLDVRLQLILYYYSKGIRNPRIGHIIWIVENHPQTPQAIFASQGMLARDNSLNTLADYQGVAATWRQVVAKDPRNRVVLSSAARFFQLAGEWDESEKLLISAGALQPGAGLGMGTDQLARLYAAAILGATGDPAFPKASSSFAARVQRDLEASDNLFLVNLVGASIRSAARRPTAGLALPPGTLNLDDHPLLVSAIDFGERLLARAGQNARIILPGEGVIGGVPGGVTGGVLGGIVGSVPTNESVVPTPLVVRKVDPEYPPLALQARIAGVVKLRITIDTTGAVKDLRATSGHPLLVPAALQAAREWRFQPPASEVATYLDIPFHLPPGVAPSPQTVTGGVLGGIVGSVPSDQLPPPPPVINKVFPWYPPLARQARISGVVKFRALIGTDGAVKHLEVISGHPLLVPAAMQAAREWKFQAPPRELTTVLDIPFTLPADDAPQAAPSVQPAPQRIRVGANVHSAKLVRKVDPIYPPQARAEGIQGDVTLQILCDFSGHVVKVTPIDGNPILAAAAQEAVRQWSYHPTLLNGQPVEVSSTVIVPFRLQ
jgi:TonB family protein